MENKLLVGFTFGFLLAFIGELIIDTSNAGFWAEVILLLIGAAIIAFLWFIRKKPSKK
jgi:Na+-driven multidrug efflux pump